MQKTDVLVIGGSAAGLVAAQVGRAKFADKDFLVVRDTQSALIPCAIPYVFGEIGTTDNNILPDGLATKNGARMMIDRVTAIDRKAKRATTEGGETIEYGKVIIATGSKPKVPGWLKGAGLKNVFTVPKNKDYIDAMVKEIKPNSTVAVIGAGFIGVELADQLRRMPMDVYLIEVLPHILGAAFDEEIAVEAEQMLTEKGVQLRTGVGVSEITGEGSVSGVTLS
ncbi:MAG: FAD-dependent oxidoreductase, partial [Alkalispirochaeta sp.]